MLMQYHGVEVVGECTIPSTNQPEMAGACLAFRFALMFPLLFSHHSFRFSCLQSFLQRYCCRSLTTFFQHIFWSGIGCPRMERPGLRECRRTKIAWNGTPRTLEETLGFDGTGVPDSCHGLLTPPTTPMRRRGFIASPGGSPDRFIPNRSRLDKCQSPTEAFHISKSPLSLSEDERLVRHSADSPDPFGPIQLQSPVRTPPASDQRQAGTEVTFRPSPAPSETWTVWQDPHSSRAVSDGRGGAFRSGSTAPMYEAHFLRKVSSSLRLIQLEQRLARAFDFDQAGRIFAAHTATKDPQRQFCDNAWTSNLLNIHASWSSCVPSTLTEQSRQRLNLRYQRQPSDEYSLLFVPYSFVPAICCIFEQELMEIQC